MDNQENVTGARALAVGDSMVKCASDTVVKGRGRYEQTNKIAEESEGRGDDSGVNASVVKDTPCSVARGEFCVPPRNNTVLAPRPGGLGYRAVKRIFDIVFSVAVVVVGLIPGILLCVAIVVDSPGAPIYRQRRVGKGGREIGIYKFRTMVADAHERPEHYMTPEQLETWRREQKLDDDPRVTRIGRVLRRTSLDELPQFLNVLIGDLSVIGPRPVTREETFEFGDGRDEFLSCKPGITGWWQVTARNDAVWADGSRQLLELFYVRHASFGLDARVFWRTFKAMGRGK